MKGYRTIFAVLSLLVSTSARADQNIQRTTNPQIDGVFVNTYIGAPDIPAHCLWTTSEDCGTAVGPFGAQSVQMGEIEALMPRRCQWTTSDECKTTDPERQLDIDFRESTLVSLPPHCLFTTSLECQPNSPWALHLEVAVDIVEYDEFCRREYPICLITLPNDPVNIDEPFKYDDGDYEVTVTPIRDVDYTEDTQTRDELAQVAARNAERMQNEIRQREERRVQEQRRPATNTSTRNESDQENSDEDRTDIANRPSPIPIIRNLFTHSPLGQTLFVDPTVLAARTASNRSESGFYGPVRLFANGEPKLHRGFDDGVPIFSSRTEFDSHLADPVVYYGTIPMHVTRTLRSTNYGYTVTLAGVDSEGNQIHTAYTHLRNPTVTIGQKLEWGASVGIGYGYGNQFLQNGAGWPHVHQSVFVNGTRRNPVSAWWHAYRSEELWGQEQ